MHEHSTELDAPDTGALAAWTGADGSELIIRRACGADLRRTLAFLRGLSYASRYFRFGRGDLEFLEREARALCESDPAVCADFVVLARTREGTTEVAAARYCVHADRRSCEFALVIADDWQGRGLGKRLLRVMIDSAHERGLRRMYGNILATNARMLRLAEALGFTVAASGEGPAVKTVERSLHLPLAPLEAGTERRRPVGTRSAHEGRLQSA